MTLELIIKSPVGFDPAVYNWPKENQDNNGALEIIETIKWVFEEFPDLNLYFQKETIFKYDSRCYESMKTLCDLYNNAIDKLIDRNSKNNSKFYNKASVNLVRHIILQAYNQSVVDPEKLNQYEPFSPEVYGETSFEFIKQMIEEVNIKNEDVFIDLGSGVGQVVLQVAACTNVKLCVGIEKAEVPAIYSEGMSDAFKFWMNWYGKKFSDYHLMKGDFFNEKYRDTINNGTFIFVNNFAFGPEVDHKLKLRFQELKDGARIVSSKAFCPLNFRITDRTLSDIGSIMQVEEIQPKYKGSVSWTGKPVSYYLHTIDRRKLEEFFLNSRAPKNKITENNDMTKNRKNSNKNQNNNFCSTSDFCSNSTKFKEDSLVIGPTTRKAWSEWCKNTQKDIEPNDKNFEASNDSISSDKKEFQNKVQSKKVNSNCTLDDYKLMTSDSESSLDTLVDQENKDEKQIINDDTDNFSKEKSIKNNSKSKKHFQSNSDSNDSKRPPGRPRKKNSTEKTKKNLNLDGLDLLHQQTVLSISSTSATEIPPGCIDKKLSFDENNLIELVNSDNSNKDYMNQSNFLDKTEISQKLNKTIEFDLSKEKKPKYSFLEYNLTLNSLVDNFRDQMSSFLEQMQNDSYKNSILEEIEKEKKINSDLKSKIETLNLQVEESLSKGLQSLKLRLNQIDITANDPNELFLEASEILEKNKELKSQVKQFENQVHNLDLINQKYNHMHSENKKLEDKKVLEKNSDLKLSFDKKKNGLALDKTPKNELKDISTSNLLISSKVNDFTNVLKKNSSEKNFYDNQFTQQYNAQLLNQNVQAQYNQLIYKDNLNLTSSNNKMLPKKNDQSFYNNQSLNNLNNTTNINIPQKTSNSSSVINNNLHKNVNSSLNNNSSQKKSNNIQAKQIKEKVWVDSKEKLTNSAKCNNIKNQNLSKENKLNETFSNDKKNGTYQFPELEDRIKSMIVAAFNDGKKKDEQAALQKITKPRKPRVTKAKSNVKNDEKIDLNSISLNPLDSAKSNNSLVYNNQSSSLSNQINSSKSSLNKTNSFDSFLKQPGSLFQNLHNHNLASYGSFLNNKKPQSNEDNREGSALKLTLKIDRERDSYTLVKSPSKSPEKVTPKCSPKYLDHIKRKHNISPDHKTKRSKSPKYSSSIQPIYEPEKRLILKVTNGQSCHIEIPKI